MKYSTVTGWAAVCLGLFVWATPAHAVNRIFLGDDVVKASEIGLTIDVKIDNDVQVYAISLAITFDPNLIEITNIQPAGVAASADWNAGTDLNQINNTAGELHYGILTDLSPQGGDDVSIGVGNNQVVATITYNTKNTDLTNTKFRFEDGFGDIAGGHINALVDDTGTTYRRGSVNTLNLTDGTLTIDPEKPIIDTTGSQNGQEGTVFQIVGRNFDKGGLGVEVNGKTATFSLRADDQTLDVTAPSCPACPNNQVECVNIEVTNVNGSDTLVDGFCYEPPPVPVIDRFQSGGTPANPGNAGDTFFVVGENFRGTTNENPIISMTICGIEMPTNQYLVLSDTTIQVTAPDCADAGWAPIQLCNPHGCTTHGEAFFYEPPTVDPLPVITTPNPDTDFQRTGLPGKGFFIAGQHFNTVGIRAEICGSPATFNVLSDTSMQITSPDCDTVGWSLLRICNDVGCANLVRGFFYEEVIVTEGEFIRGDVNVDQALDISDAITLLGDLFLGIKSPACRDALDVNDDGQTDISDAISFLAAQFLGTFVIPPPSPRPGKDPTADILPICPP